MEEIMYNEEKMLKVKRLNEDAKLPVCANPGFDLGYDLFASEDTVLYPDVVMKVKTGIAFEFTWGHGALLRDRSSMAAKGVTISGGVIDAGYRGEISVLMSVKAGHVEYDKDNFTKGYQIKKGDKIAQMIPLQPQTMFVVEWADELSETGRGENGFGSTGS